MDDAGAWQRFPDNRKWFNKLYVNSLVGNRCGPCGVAPERSGEYIVRPIYNLSGMSADAEKKFINSGDATQVPPGYFWCEWFEGVHYSATYTWIDKVGWQLKSCWQAEKDLLKFTRWIRSGYAPGIPRALDELADLPLINAEFIGQRLIEVHLRDTSDPDYNEIVPVWQNDSIDREKYFNNGYHYIESYDDADGFIDNPRLGFFVK